MFNHSYLVIFEKICFVLGSFAPWKEMKKLVPLPLPLICSNSESYLFSYRDNVICFCSVEVKICKVLCFFYFELWLIIRQPSMACNVDESKSFELKGTITIIIVIKNYCFSLYTQKLFSLKHMPRDVVR